MTSPRRSWLATFADERHLAALLDAARSCMADVCEEHEPAECDCRDQMMTPLEFAEWVETEVRRRSHNGQSTQMARDHARVGAHRRVSRHLESVPA